MTEVVASLIGAIVGSVITLMYAHWHEKTARETERRILRSSLLEECLLQINVLEALRSQYAQPKSVHPARVSSDLFQHALNRHVGELGDTELIRRLSQVVLHARALNTALDRYEPALLEAMDDRRRLPNIEHSRIAICNNIKLCKQVIETLKAHVQS